MQVDPTKSMLKPPGTKHLKRTCDMLLSTFASTFSLRRYSKVDAWAGKRKGATSRVPLPAKDDEGGGGGGGGGEGGGGSGGGEGGGGDGEGGAEGGEEGGEPPAKAPR